MTGQRKVSRRRHPAPSDLLQAKVADIAHASEQLEADVLPWYGGEHELPQTDPRGDLGELDDQRGEQTVTLLQLLGYLPEPPAPPRPSRRTGRRAPQAQPWVWKGADIARAWTEWRAERIAMATETDSIVTIEVESSDRRQSWNTDALRRDLKACASLEGEVRFSRWPVPAVVSLASRIALMRLRLFGLYGGMASDPMPADTEAILAEQARKIAADMGLSPTEILNRLGDIEGVTSTVIERLRGKFAILRAPGQPGYVVDIAPLNVDDDHPIRALNLKNERIADWNRFSLRLLQLRLWTLGYYPGEVDGVWKEMSAKALGAFFRDYEIKHLDRLVGSVKGGWVVIDLARALQHFVDEVDAPARQLDRVAIDERLNDPQAIEHRELWERLAKAHEADREAAADGAPGGVYEGDDFRVFGARNLRRKRYFGWRGIFAAFGRLLRQAAASIKAFISGLIRAIKKGFGYARNVVRYVVDSTRVAVRVAGLAVQRLHCWLTGTPVITSPAPGVFGVATFWQHDFDTINLVARNCPPETQARHRQTLDWMQRSVGIMLRIGAAVFQLVLTIGNWLAFAWRALRLMRQMIRETRDPLFAELLADNATT